jgi:hypothetical protein
MSSTSSPSEQKYFSGLEPMTDKDQKRPLTRFEREDRAITILWIVLFGPFLLGLGLWAVYLMIDP